MIRSSHTRRGRAAAAIAVAALAVAATSMGAHASSPPTAPAGSAGPSGGTLVFGITTDPDTLFPWKATQFQAVDLLQNIYGTLTEFDQDLNVVPGLAKSWDTSDDGMTVTLHLRDGVTFDDGSAFDSADVKSTRSTRSRTRRRPRSPPARSPPSPASTPPTRRRSC